MSVEARLEDSNRNLQAKVKRLGRPRVAFPIDKAPKPQATGALLTLQEVCEALDMYPQRVYVLCQKDLLHPLQRGGKGRVYYADWEVEELRAKLRLGSELNIPYIAA